jgi:hypothetical protein
MHPKAKKCLQIGIILPLVALAVVGFLPIRMMRRPATFCRDVGEDWMVDDAQLLRQVSKQQLIDLCLRYNLTRSGTKSQLLYRLRDFASSEAERARINQLNRVQKIDNAKDLDHRERYEIVSEEIVDDFDEGFFFFDAPGDWNATNANEATTTEKQSPLTSTTVTAPPPPTEPNADGEYVRTLYSTTDLNDLTGVAAAQPGAGGEVSLNDLSSSSFQKQPWDHQRPTHAVNEEQVERARTKIVDLVSTLLAMTGAPGFMIEGDDDDDDGLDTGVTSLPPNRFVGFHPANVPTAMLTDASRDLRMQRGQLLREVLRQFEMRAIGYDGLRGDEQNHGDGHYREVQKVGSFLEGFRKAEVRRISRETTVLLLEKLLTEGVEGLDLTLASLKRSSDDTGEYELNDSLLDFLNDSIRQQEKKVIGLNPKTLDQSSSLVDDEELDSEMNDLWNVTVDEDGQRVEALDPNDPKVRKFLLEQAAKEDLLAQQKSPDIPKAVPEKLLLLLTLLRDRIKTEAVFSSDEKGRNLRLLAYCLRLPDDKERQQLILKELGTSLTVRRNLCFCILPANHCTLPANRSRLLSLSQRLDSFVELVASSIEYGESSSYALQPAQKQKLNVPLLKHIMELTSRLRKEQSRKASGLL